jgi:hypothetical protein
VARHPLRKELEEMFPNASGKEINTILRMFAIMLAAEQEEEKDEE